MYNLLQYFLLTRPFLFIIFLVLFSFSILRKINNVTPIKKKFVVIIIDGIIGAGKSTLIKILEPKLSERGFKVTVVHEPVEKWKINGSLEQFYNNPKRRGFQFQVMAFHDRVALAQEMFDKKSEKTDVFLLERSIFTDMLFLQMLYDSGMIDDSEKRDYENLWKMWKQTMPFNPDMFVYLRPNIQVAMERLNKRARSGEDKVSLEYQKKLQKKHDDFFTNPIIDGNAVRCFRLNIDEDFKNDKIIQDTIVQMFEKDIIKIMNEK